MRSHVNWIMFWLAAVAASVAIEAAEPVVPHERLDRGLVARNVADGKVYLGWRLLRSDPADVAFDVFRRVGDAQPVKLNAEPVRKTTDFVDAAPPKDGECRYFVRTAGGGGSGEGGSGEACESVAVRPGEPPSDYPVDQARRRSHVSEDRHRRPRRRRAFRLRHQAAQRQRRSLRELLAPQPRAPTSSKPTATTASSCGATTWAGRSSRASGTRPTSSTTSTATARPRWPSRPAKAIPATPTAGSSPGPSTSRSSTA